MDDQVASVAEYDLGNYRRDIEVQKSEIDKQIAEQRIALQQEKTRLIDGIQKDTLLNEQQKQEQINYLNQTYSNLIDNIAAKEVEVNNQFNTATQNVL
jgi:N-acetylneuraminic acid mutarotase